ncbi:MAG: hypothetical protein ACO1QS_17710 [Verrucomicrobiota bacterium]
MNDRDLVARIEKTGKELRRPETDKASALDKQVRELEALVGIDPGGWSMNGLRIFRPTPQIQQALKPLGIKLSSAMEQADVSSVKATIAEMTHVMGDQVGTPDARRKGERARKIIVTEAENAAIFLRALESDGKNIRQIRAGQPLPGQMLRTYASLARAICDIRPAVQKHAPDRMTELDAVLKGACRIMLDLQQPEGYFPFPDLRGKNIRFGEMTEHLLEQGAVKIMDGWIVSVDPSGGTQFDTGECGLALLQAGESLGNADWTKAGLKAADWAMKQKCVGNFNYNAFSVSLLAQAYATTKDEKYWQAAWQKWSLGVAPGQVTNGRWIDPHNARTVYHLIIVRAMNDLLAVIPSTFSSSETAALRQATEQAMQVVTEEFAKLGVTNTSFALRELIRFRDLRSADMPELPTVVEQAAAVVYSRSVQGDRAKFGASVTELAIMHQAFAPAGKP